MQNSEFAFLSSRSGKHMKQMPRPPFWGGVGVKKVVSVFRFGHSKSHFRAPENAKSAHFQVPENGTSSARIQKRRPLFHGNIPPKWWTRHLFHVFTTFGWEISKFWILHILASFLECKRGIFFKVVAKPGKCPKNQNFCRNGLYTCWYKVYQEAMRFWKLFDFLVHPTLYWLLLIL